MSDQKSDGKKPRRPVQHIILMLVGVVSILISLILRYIYKAHEVFAGLFHSLGDALIIGPALSWILDLPGMINYFKQITIESLISNDYLKSLEPKELVQLRKDCTAIIHLKDSENIEKGLINLDENICTLLTQPYCERYRQNTTFTIEGDSFRKKHHFDELVRNPLDKKIPYDDFPKIYLDVKPGQNVADVMKILKFSVKIDDLPEKDITPDIQIKVNKNGESDVHYGSYITIHHKNNANEPLSFEYTKTIEVSRIIEVLTPKSDTSYIKRVKIPVKSFKVDYTYNSNGQNAMKLIGSCFGTLSYSNDGGIKVIQGDNYISIESFNWLLPGNGIYIVKVI